MSACTYAIMYLLTYVSTIKWRSCGGVVNPLGLHLPSNKNVYTYKIVPSVCVCVLQYSEFYNCVLDILHCNRFSSPFFFNTILDIIVCTWGTWDSRYQINVYNVMVPMLLYYNNVTKKELCLKYCVFFMFCCFLKSLKR